MEGHQNYSLQCCGNESFADFVGDELLGLVSELPQYPEDTVVSTFSRCLSHSVNQGAELEQRPGYLLLTCCEAVIGIVRIGTMEYLVIRELLVDPPAPGLAPVPVPVPNGLAPVPVLNGVAPVPVLNGLAPVPVANGVAPVPVPNGIANGVDSDEEFLDFPEIWEN